MTQKEIVVRFLRSRGIGNWVPSHDIVKSATRVIGKDYILQDGDTRAYNIIKNDGGIFESQNNLYHIEHRRIGKYAEFRIIKVEPLEEDFIPGVGYIPSYKKLGIT